MKHTAFPLLWTATLAACGGGEVSPEGAPEGEITPAAETAEAELTPAARIERGLEQLEHLEVIEVGAVFSTRTEHGWVPYGGFWNSQPVELSEDEVAERVEAFTDRAQAAVAAVEGNGIGDDPRARCFPVAEDAYCLTIDSYEADVAALNALEIVEVAGIMRDPDAQQGMCYSSWITVTADDCTRAHQLHAIVEATRDLPASALPPAEVPVDE